MWYEKEDRFVRAPSPKGYKELIMQLEIDDTVLFESVSLPKCEDSTIDDTNVFSQEVEELSRISGENSIFDPQKVTEIDHITNDLHVRETEKSRSNIFELDDSFAEVLVTYDETPPQITPAPRSSLAMEPDLFQNCNSNCNNTDFKKVVNPNLHSNSLIIENKALSVSPASKSQSNMIACTSSAMILHERIRELEQLNAQKQMEIDDKERQIISIKNYLAGRGDSFSEEEDYEYMYYAAKEKLEQLKSAIDKERNTKKHKSNRTFPQMKRKPSRMMNISPGRNNGSPIWRPTPYKAPSTIY